MVCLFERSAKRVPDPRKKKLLKIATHSETGAAHQPHPEEN